MKNHLSLRTLFALLGLSTALTATTTAWAAPAASDAEAPSSVVAGAAPQAPETAADPNIDRGFIQPTAMTQPAGSLTYNNYELLLHGFTYGITDHLQASVTVLSPIVKDMPLFGVASAKWQFLSTPLFHLALQGSASIIHVTAGSDDVVSGSRNAYLMGAGAFASYCLREDCSSLLSISATYELGLHGGGTDPAAHAIVYGGSIVHRVTQHVKLLGEVTSMAGRGAGSTFENVSGALVSYGVRLHTANIASDVGFVKPVGSDGNDPFLLGLPFINVSYRWQ